MKIFHLRAAFFLINLYDDESWRREQPFRRRDQNYRCQLDFTNRGLIKAVDCVWHQQSAWRMAANLLNGSLSNAMFTRKSTDGVTSRAILCYHKNKQAKVSISINKRILRNQSGSTFQSSALLLFWYRNRQKQKLLRLANIVILCIFHISLHRAIGAIKYLRPFQLLFYFILFVLSYIYCCVYL